MRWFDRILQLVTPQTEKPVIVIDTQGFLLLPEFQARLCREGYELVFASPGIEARMKYELDVRGKKNAMLIITGWQRLVDDMKLSAFAIDLRARDVFRNFDEKAIKGLSYKELCRLDRLQVYEVLGYEATIRLVEDKVKKPAVEVELEETASLLANLKNSTFDIMDVSAWFALAPKLGEAGESVYRLHNQDLTEKFMDSMEHLNKDFQVFMEAKYEGLFSRSGLRHPYTIDKIQDFIASNSKERKIAFIVIDGMNYWQWTMLKLSLEECGLAAEDKASLSWLPSITAWARQSLFSGERPDTSIDNHTEGTLFIEYWTKKQHRNKYQVSYQKLPKDCCPSVPAQDITVAGYVSNALDDLMHGTVLGYEQLFQATALWIKKSCICEWIKDLKNGGFDIYVSTDHGNVDANLCLKLSAGQKAVMNSRSKRFVQFDTEYEAESFTDAHPDFALGSRERCVYFKDSRGFGSSGQTEITHGGSHLMEMLIPLGVIK